MTVKKKLYKPLRENWKPDPHQVKALEFLLAREGAGLFLDPGMGKTSVTLAAVRILLQKKLASKILIIAPLRVCYLVWPAEIKKWTEFANITYSIVHGPKMQEALDTPADIYLINPAGLDWLLGSVKSKSAVKKKVSVKVDINTFVKFKFDVLVVDELTAFKHPSSQRSKALKQILHLFKRRWGLTGSAAAGGLMNLFGQVYVLDRGATFGPYVTKFRDTYFTLNEYNGRYTLKPGADELIYKAIKPICLHIPSEGNVKKPKLKTIFVDVKLDEQTQILYDVFEDALVAEFKGRTIVAKTASVKSMKCRQIACGSVYAEPDIIELLNRSKRKVPKQAGRDWIDIHNFKVDAVLELIDELQGSPLLLGYQFEHECTKLVDAIKRGFGYDPVVMGSSIAMADLPTLESRWNDGDIPVMLGHPEAIGHGLNLQKACHHVGWSSIPWDLELYFQFLQRVWRRGNPFDTVYNHLFWAPSTVDRIMWMSITQKISVQDAFNTALK